jgi:hypothetical protein
MNAEKKVGNGLMPWKELVKGSDVSSGRRIATEVRRVVSEAAANGKRYQTEKFKEAEELDGNHMVGGYDLKGGRSTPIRT